MSRKGRNPYVDITNKTFGQLTAVERVVVTKSSGKKEGRWRCVCACGKETVVRCSVLLNGNTKSCGCWRGHPIGYGVSARNSILSRYKHNAESAGRVWQLTEEMFDALTSGPCHYCGSAPTNKHVLHTGFGEFVYNGIDRKDSARGYEIDNVVSCCKVCQKAKSNMPYEKFIAFLRQAGEYQLAVKPLSREAHAV